MKIDSLSILNSALQTLSQRALTRDYRQLQRFVHGLAPLSDEQMAHDCRALLSGAELTIPASEPPLPLFLRTLLRKVLFRPLSDSQLNALAYGIELFRRVPADLGPGAQLYPEQEQAAAGLLQNTVIQMDTGEGKTYALLPAAFALATTCTNVYILCANDYLARRDAMRTRRYWEFAGIIPGVGADDSSCDPREWSRRVIYTTITQLLFKYMRDQDDWARPDYPITLGAILLDDADYVLLDDASVHNLVWEVSGGAFDWDFAFSFCDELSEGETIKVLDFQETPSAALTLKGEELLREKLGPRGRQAGIYLLARYAVELTYLAKKILREGDHYVIEPDGVFPINRTDGRIMRTWFPDWLPALYAAHGMPPLRSRRIINHQMRPSVLIKKFALHSGVSGTVSSDALEFLLGYRMRPVRIAPRLPRHDGLLPEDIFRAAPAAQAEAAGIVAKAVDAGRPVLVGTHTIGAAKGCYDLLEQRLSGRANVRLLTGQSDALESSFFDQAGIVGSVTVATQIAGRGVDIRLTEQARENGGLVLLGLGHSRLARHDRQFLGRAGRQGDPYSAKFVSSLDDPFFKEVPVNAVKAFMAKLNVPADVPIEVGPVLGRAIASIQMEYRWRQLLSRRAEMVLDYVDEQIGDDIEEYLSHLQALTSSQGAESGIALTLLVDFLIESFISTNLASMVTSRRPLTSQQAARLAEAIAAITGYNPNIPAQKALTLNLLGRTGAEARDMVSRVLRDAVSSAATVNARYMSRLSGWADAEGRADDDLARYGQLIEQLGTLKRVIEEKIAQQDQPVVSVAPPMVPAAELAGQHDERAQAIAAPAEAAVVPAESTAVASAESTAVVPAGAEGPAPVTGTPVTDRLQRSGNVTVAHLVAAIAEASGQEDLAALARYVETAQARIVQRLPEARRQAAGDARQEWSAVRRRTPDSVAWWSIHTALAAFIAQRDITTEALRMASLPPLQYFRILNDRLLEQWQLCESELASTTLTNLCRCWCPRELDGLYIVADNIVAQEKPTPEEIPDWQPSATDIQAKSAPDDNAMIFLFIKARETALGEGEIAQLVRLLKDFLADAPLRALQTSEQIQRKVIGWRRDQRLRGIPERRWRTDLGRISEFLQFLRERGSIGPLPNAKVRLKVSFGRLFENLSEVRTFLPLAGAMALAAIYAVLSTVHLGPARHLPPVAYLTDGLVSGGLVGARAFTGTAIAGIVAGSVLMTLLRSRQSARPAKFLLSSVPWALLTAWSITWPWGQVLSLRMAEAAGMALGTALLLFVTIGAEFNFELWGGFQLLTLWIFATSCLVFLPRLSTFGPADSGITIAAFAVLVAAYVLLHRFNRGEITVQFRHARQVGEAEEGDLANTGYRIMGACGPQPHGFGLICAFAFERLIAVVATSLFHQRLSTDTGMTISIAAYCSVVFIWIMATIERRCSVTACANSLNSRSQVLGTEYADRQLPGVLKSIQRKLFYRETLTQVVLIAATYAALYRYRVPGTTVPLALPLIFGAVLCAEQCVRIVGQFYAFLFLRAPAAPAAIDLPPYDDRPGGGLLSRALRAARKKLGRVIGIVIAVITFSAAIVDAENVWRTVGDWMIHLFHL